MSFSGHVERELTEGDLAPENWVQAHGDILFRFAMARVRNALTAEELVQETFLAALKGLAGFQKDSSLRTWLVAILRRKIVDFVRKKKRIESQETSVENIDEVGRLGNFTADGEWKHQIKSWASNGKDVLERQEFWEMLKLCLAHLPPRLREAFLLREMKELETGEVCDHLGITANSLAVRTHRARLALRDCLENHLFGPQR